MPDWLRNLRCWLFHKPDVVRDTGVWLYEECVECGRRSVVQRMDGYQPVDMHWLVTGEWSPTPRPPDAGSAVLR